MLSPILIYLQSARTFLSYVTIMGPICHIKYHRYNMSCDLLLLNEQKKKRNKSYYGQGGL